MVASFFQHFDAARTSNHFRLTYPSKRSLFRILLSPRYLHCYFPLRPAVVAAGLQTRSFYCCPVVTAALAKSLLSSYVGIPPSNLLKSPSMTCSNCGKEMTAWELDGRLGSQITIDVCTNCQAFWFDKRESLQLSPGATLKLMKFIGEHSSTVKVAQTELLRCPRCSGRLSLAHDMVRNMKFSYWACPHGHGHFIAFFDFLKEKNFIRALSSQEIQHLKLNVQSVNCSNCGASIDLQANSACPFCHSPISILDMKEQQQMLAQLKEAAEPRPLDPALPLKLARAKAETSALFDDGYTDWWGQADSGDLVHAGLKWVARRLIPHS